MHWCWRATAATMFGVVVAAVTIDAAHTWLGPNWADFFVVPAGVGSYFGTALAYGVLTEKTVPKQFDPETRCRKCGEPI